jgi:hypothetical protein
MGDLNFDALRAEAGLGEGHTMTLGGREFHLPAIMPLTVASGDFEESLEALFGEDADLDFLKQHLSAIRSDRPFSQHDPENPETDIDAIAEKLYGIKPAKKHSPNREARRARARE